MAAAVEKQRQHLHSRRVGDQRPELGDGVLREHHEKYRAPPAPTVHERVKRRHRSSRYSASATTLEGAAMERGIMIQNRRGFLGTLAATATAAIAAPPPMGRVLAAASDAIGGHTTWDEVRQ